MNIDFNDLPETITVTVYPQASTKYNYFTTSYREIKSEEYVTLGEGVEVTFIINKKEDLTKEIVSTLRQEQQTLRAECEQKVTRIEERIQSMLALEGPKE